MCCVTIDLPQISETQKSTLYPEYKRESWETDSDRMFIDYRKCNC